ncbi:AraC family transcriptional regulator [Microvirga sp. BSC39]|uniref:AraC family transcriptional regulator n=1 Tax=Microvirga sp. BSC39 TaxID=1549810 RepID=UPI0009DF4C87|nr:AraC family transcriptional regulator [Microvirga sp. BSC39]
MSIIPGTTSRLIMSTDAIPAREREAVAREFFGNIAMRLDLAPAEGGRLRLNTSTLILPNITTSSGAVDPMSWNRTKSLISDGNDDLCISWMAGHYRLVQPGQRDIEIRPGSGCLTALDRRWKGTTSDGSWMMCIHFKRSTVATLVNNVDDIAPDKVDMAAPESRLLFDYLRLIHTIEGLTSHSPVVARHLTDLLALALGANRDGEETARTGGVRAARLAAIKQYIAANLTSTRLSAETTAANLSLSSRYIRSLFAEQGTTFTDYVNERRLRRAYDSLRTQGSHSRPIADIAFDVGFVEPSTFYRLFRARYQLSPSDVRNL